LTTSSERERERESWEEDLDLSLYNWCWCWLLIVVSVGQESGLEIDDKGIVYKSISSIIALASFPASSLYLVGR
jgi:hypothetical protein